jgi:hypothetical protein
MKLLLLLLLALPCLGQDYFPKACFSSREDLQQFTAGWYSSQLKALQEAPLFTEKIDPNVECYRFTWLRTFHHPAVFRLDVGKDHLGKLTIKVADGAGGYEPGKLIRNEIKELDERAVRSITARFRFSEFFKIPSYEENRGLDGAEWVVEAVSDGKYHIVTRWCPADGPIRKIGMEFIELAIGGDLTPIY